MAIIIVHINHDQESATSIACSYGLHETVKLLLDKGAIVDRKCMENAIKKGFRYKANCMNITTSTFFSFTAKVLIQSSQWHSALRQTLNGDPIMNEVIRKMPGT